MATTAIGKSTNSASPGETLILKQHLSRPAGYAFLGAKATTVDAWIGQDRHVQSKIIVDSGSDITLMSDKLWNSLTPRPKLRTGPKINLVQVTGKSSISGFAELPLVFDTPQGPVQLAVEAFIVKGMNTPFILGNDFADQYALSIVRKIDSTHLVFGSSGRQIPVSNTVGPIRLDDNGQTFNIIHSKKGLKRHHRKTPSTTSIPVTAANPCVIHPHAVLKVPVQVSFPGGIDQLFVEKVLSSRQGEKDFFGAPDSLITKTDPFLHISNFSDRPIRLSKGELLGLAHDPRLWLNKYSADDSQESERLIQHAMAISSVISEVRKTHNSETVGEEPVEGGPKTGETPDPTPIPKEELLTAVDIAEHLNQDQRQQLETVLRNNEQAFGLDGRLGEHNAHLKIHLKPDAKEVSLAPYSASPAKREVIDAQLDSWLSLKVIEPSESPWGFPVLIVYRNDKPRLCIDYRKLNAMTVPDEYPLPKQSDIIQSLTGSQWLSTLDALSGFTQIQVDEADRPKTAFRTHRGLFQFKRMPFGLRNAPAFFQRVMQNVLAPYLWIFALVYIDDIIIYSRTFKDHLKHLDSVLKAISKSGITLSPKKCHIGYQSLLLLGQKVSRLGMSTHKEKVKAILDLDTPRNVSELRTFHGMMVYFSGYIPFYAWIVAPLFALLKKDVPWHWEELQDRAFSLAKESLINSPIRAYAVPGRGYRLYTDACDEGLAGILQQIQPIKISDLKGTRVYDKLKKAFLAKQEVPPLVTIIVKDHEMPLETPHWAKNFEDTVVMTERVIGYWSRILKPAERNYSPTEREALALKESLIKFQPYIEGEKLVAITDHAALTWSKTYQNVNRRLLTWGTVFAAYPDMVVVHRAGRVHSNVDPISRLRRRIPYQIGPVTDDTKALTLDMESADPLNDLYQGLAPGYEERVLKLMKDLTEKKIKVKIEENSEEISIPAPQDTTITMRVATTFNTSVSIDPNELEEFKNGYLKDPHFSEVLKDLSAEVDWQNPARPQYYSSEGLIYFTNWEDRSRLCVPKSKRNEIMTEVHELLSEGAHQGFAKTYNRIASLYYWPRMSRDIKMFVGTCDSCQKMKPRRHAPYGLMKSIPIPSRPFEVVSMDFITELPASNGKDAILVIVDKLTKFAIFIPTTTKIGEIETAKLFFDHVWKDYGMPLQIISDRDARWSNSFWKEVTRLTGSKRALTTAHHPQADGQTEIMNQVLEVALRTYSNAQRDDWTAHLTPFQHAYNNSVHSSTGHSPLFLLCGFHPTSPESLLSGVNQPSVTRDHIENKDAEAFTEEISALRNQALNSLKIAQVHQQKAYNNGRLDMEFEEGDQVLINPHSMKLVKDVAGLGKKLMARYDGPFEVIRKLSPLTYQLRLPASYQFHPVISIAHLQPYKTSPKEFGDRSKTRLNREDFEKLPEYEVEAIIGEFYENVRARKAGGKGRRLKRYVTRFIGYGPEADDYLTKSDLRNAPEILQAWENRDRTQDTAKGYIFYDPRRKTPPKEQDEAPNPKETETAQQVAASKPLPTPKAQPLSPVTPVAVPKRPKRQK